jgi:transcriptional regulator with GAF, ATPase, and Fis domain
MSGASTVDDSLHSRRDAGRTPQPGLVVVFSGQTPLVRAIAVPAGAGVVLGRDDAGGLSLPDPRSSRGHMRARLVGAAIVVEDLQSRNGSTVDGVALPPGTPRAVQKVVRMGHTVLVPVADVRPFAAGVGQSGELVAGPALQAALAQLTEAARSGGDALVLGESGTGKEHAARHFHAACGGKGPLVPVNCATIPTGVAERLLFGTRKGAYSGASSDAEGYFEAAEGGVLFLDELGELELAVQAKLLRVLQTREILPLGASRPQPVRVRVCAATNRDLRQMAATGGFREDLWYRLAEHAVHLPPLRDRREEIGFLLARFVRELVGPTMGLHATIVEAACLRPWPGNVRELRAAARKAAQAAARRGSDHVSDVDLEAQAGMSAAAVSSIVPAAAVTPAGDSKPPRSERPGPRPVPAKVDLEAALAAAENNVSRAARALGVPRTQLYRWLERYGITVRSPGGDEPGDD